MPRGERHSASACQPVRPSFSTKGLYSTGTGENTSEYASGWRTRAPSGVVTSPSAQPREKISSPAGSFQRNSATPNSKLPCVPRCSSRASVPIVRNSSPTQLLSADGVSVYRLVQPTPSFSSDTGGKKAPARSDQRQGEVDTGRQRRYAESTPSSGEVWPCACRSATASRESDNCQDSDSAPASCGEPSPSPKRILPSPPSVHEWSSLSTTGKRTSRKPCACRSCAPAVEAAHSSTAVA